MEKGAVSLVKISPHLETNYINAITSPKLCHLCVISNNEYACVYTILNDCENGPSLKLIWESPCKVISCRFSEDGTQLFVILPSRSFQIYSINSSLQLVADEDSIFLSALLENTGVEVVDTTDVKTVTFNRSQLTVLIENKWLVSFLINYSEPFSVRSIVEVPSCVAVETSKELIYCMTSGGNVSAYSVENGKEAGLINLYSLLPYGSEFNDIFTSLTVSANGSVIAVSDAGGKVYIANIRDVFTVTNLQEERWDCGGSIISASSGTSYTSIRTVSSLLRIQPTGSVGDSASIYMFELTEKDKCHSYKSPWDSYLDSLKQSKQAETGNDRKVSKFWSSKREIGNTHLMCISEPPSSLIVQSLQMTAGGLAVWYTKPDSRLGGIYKLFEIPSRTCVAEQIVPDDTSIIAGGCLGLMDAFLSPSCMWLFLGNLSRDALVNKLLHCVETEAIGQLLQGGEWGDLVIPLPTLADGLKQHQMDVARLALGLHSQAFKSSVDRRPAESVKEWQMRIQSISSNMDKLFEIVYNALLENKQKLAFSEQLILLYLDHANDLLQFLHESINAQDISQSTVLNDLIKKKKRAIIKQIMFHVVELRGHLRKKAKASFDNVSMYQPLGCLTDGLKKEWSMWQTMEDDDVIHQGIAANNFPLLQTFLIICRGWSSSNILQGIRRKIFIWLEELLVNQEIETSIQILTNLGLEPYEELRDICLKSVDKGLRDNLALYLAERNLLNLDELEAWDMLKIIEEILDNRPLSEPKFAVAALPVENRHVAEFDVPEVFRGDGKLSIRTVIKQPEDWKNKVLTELYFNTLEPKLELLIEPEIAWKFLLYNNREDLLMAWINIYYSKFESICDTLVDNENVTREVHHTTSSIAVQIQKLFSVWDVTQHMIDSINDVNCMTKTKETLLDHLSRFGVFTSSDQLNPSSILKRFCRTQCLNNIREILNQPSANMTFCNFEDTFLKFCIKHNLFNLMFTCFQNSDFSCDRVKSICSSSDFKEEEINWFRLWLIMRQMNESLTDESIVYEAVKETTQYLSRGNMDLYLKEHPLVVLATIVFGKKTLKDIVESGDSSDFPIKSSVCQAALKQLPFLDVAFSSQDYPSREQDVTVYQLLQDSSPFDVSKLFDWQSVHTMKGDEMPHFASEKLSLKYGHNVTLDYLYYLKQGRPCYAANLFIVEELKRHKKISRKMKKRVCNSAHGLALQNFTNQGIVCACVAFIEILGADSEIVRIHVAAANKILNYLKTSVLESTDNDNLLWEQVDKLMYGLIVAKEQASEEILPLLETALYHNYLQLESSDSIVVKHLLHWDMAVKFAKYHHLKLPEQFLKHCARKNMWLEFVLFIQIHQYPVEQVLLLVNDFESAQLQEHLSHALSHKMALKHESSEVRGRSKLKARDSRKVLYSKIGVHKEEGASDVAGESPNQETDNVFYGSSSSSEDSWLSEMSISYELDSQNQDACADIFYTLLNCHRSPDPPRALLAACQSFMNPVMAIFATCYEPSSVLACFCTWLVTSLANHMSVQLKSELSSALQIHAWSPRQVQALLEEAVAVQSVKTLSRGFRIFFPENPLCIFTEFLVECAVKKNFKESITKMKMFKASCLNMKNNPSIMDSEDLEGTFLNNGHWIGSVAVCTACITLANCFSSSYHELLFLNTLCEASFADQLPVNAPDFELLAKVAECLSDSGVNVDWVSLCKSNTCTEYQTELQKCLDQLVEIGKYQQALNFSVLVGLPKDSVLIAQWSNEFRNSNLATESHYQEGFVDNLNKCHEAFVRDNINCRMAINFFKELADRISLHKERYHILKFSLKWLRELKKLKLVSNGNIEDVEKEEDDIELEMWKCLLQSDIELEDTLFEGITVTGSRLFCNTKAEIQSASRMSSFQNNTILDNIQPIEHLDMLIGKLLDQGDVCTACRLQAMFSHLNQDLQLILVCLSLAEGEITPYQLSVEHRMLLSEKRNKPGSGYKRRALHSIQLGSASSSGMATPGSSNSASSQSINLEIADINLRERQETLSVLEKLVENIQHGQKLGSRLIFCFCVSMNLDRPFQDILKLEDPVRLLNTVVAEEFSNKWQVASDIILAAQLNSEDIATILCEEIVSAIKNYIKGETNELLGITLWGCVIETNFHRVLELCNEPSKLGTKLLKEAIRLGTVNPDSNKEVVEILIRAHDCYTAALNMEGIAAVLHRVRTLTNNLLQREEWALMVRLLTGIGRYTEMNYIFQILKDNEQFEYLLGRIQGEVKDLKSAILDFLKAHCPEDRESYKLVCLHYSMFSEIAELWENEGYEEVHSLLTLTKTSPVLLSNTEDTRKTLHNAMQYFTHAAEYYLQAERLTKALLVSYQAELIALQTSLLSVVSARHQVDSLLELSSDEVSSIIAQKLSFPQACIVARAYSHSVDWGEALYQHCIVEGDISYLPDFVFNKPLTTALVEDVARRFQLEPNRTQEMYQQMKKFVLDVPDIEVKYRVASQLGFRDIVENLVNSPDVPYLKDTVWRSGYSKKQPYL